MTDPWNFAGESPSLLAAGGTLTLVEGSSFCISQPSADILPGTAHGLFFRDTRLISRFELRINGEPCEVLAAAVTDPFSGAVAMRTRPVPGRADSHLLILRARHIGRGMRDDITVRNFGDEPAYCSVEVSVDADFADLFEVKEGRPPGPGHHTVTATADSLVFKVQRGGSKRGVRVGFRDQPHLAGNAALFEVIIPARGTWSTCVEVWPIIDDDEIAPLYRCGQAVEHAAPGERLEQWRKSIPAVTTDSDVLRDAIVRSAEDLGALRIFDPEHPERAVIAAGAPWFMTLFGRDSLLTSWMALLVDPDLALGVLQTLARFQGKTVDPRNEEEPGRILHEMRFGDAVSLSLGGGRVYYGTADATPLFVMLLGELRRWGLAREAVDQLLPHADAAMQWVHDFGDRDGDGYVEYQRSSDRGLVNQGWKDSWDGVQFASGELARTPIALAEVQAYVYGAYLARSYFAAEAGDGATADRYRRLAIDLKERFNRDFWLEDRGWFAVGLDRDKRPIDSLTSNMGHCLWTGIVDEDKAARVAEHLVGPHLFSGWGVRTLGTNMAGYNPISYHCGSVWPHDNAIVAAGLMRYGFEDAALRIIGAMLDASATQGGRLPELFSGLDRGDFPTVVSYPTSCSPQAWAAAAPLLFLRTMLRIDPWVPHGKVWIAPRVPESIGYLRVDRIPLAGGRVSVEVTAAGDVKVTGMPPGIDLVVEPRHPLTGH